MDVPLICGFLFWVDELFGPCCFVARTGCEFATFGFGFDLFLVGYY